MTAIYQQARPYTFDQVIGQEHVKEVLVAALKRQRIGHAYLFSGPRGVGKTTTARLLAMSVNCEQASPEMRPCGHCESCTLVRSGSHPDVIELDAASNNSVEDIRDLREKVSLAAIRGGKRVWVLDEAHMLSKSASNALLKTLEEPPPNLVFVLATTEPEKLPPTILSRCQHFRFRRLLESEISSKLKRLCQEAGVAAESEALLLVAKAADGAMRDAESLLERLLIAGKDISFQDAEAALGLPPKERLQRLAQHLVTGELGALFEGASELYHDGFSPRSLAEHLTVTLREALYQQVGISESNFALKLEQNDLLRVIHALDDEAERFVRRNDLFSLEVALIKTMNALLHNVPKEAVSSTEPVAEPTTRTGSSLPDFDPIARGKPAEVAKAAPKPGMSEAAKNLPKANWHSVLSKAGAQLKAFMMPAEVSIDKQDIYLSYPETHKFHFEQLKKRSDELSTLVAKVLGEGFKLHIQGPGEASRKKL